jgi:potassium-dependent mechanosensitive channel
VKRPLIQTLTLIVSLCLVATSFGQDAANSPELLNSSEIRALTAKAESDDSLDAAAKEELLGVLERTQSVIKRTDSYRELTKNYSKAQLNAGLQASEINKKLEAAVSGEQEVFVEFEKTMLLTDLEHQLQKDKADLATESAHLSEAKSKLQVEGTRANEVRLRQAELKKTQESLSAQPAASATGTATDLEKAQRWLYLAQLDSTQAEITMLEAELLSSPMRVDLLKAQQDRSNYQVALLQERIKTYELYVIKLRQEEAEKALSEAESVAEKAEGKHPLILQLATGNAALSAQTSQVTADLEDIRAEELRAREQAQRYEDDLQGIQKKLEIIGMSQALGQVLREQQIRLPGSAQVQTSPSEREKKISSSSLRQLEYEDERRRIANIRAYLEKLTENLSSEEKAAIEDELKSLAIARRDSLTIAVDLEASYLRVLGDLDFTARRLKASADHYSAFITERLLWIRTSAPFSPKTVLALGPEMVRIFEPKQWLQLMVSLVGNVFTSVIYLIALLLIAVMIRFRPRLLGFLAETAEHVGNVEKDKLRYSFIALGLTLLLALRWPFLMFTLGLVVDDSQTQPALGEHLSWALIRTSYYFYGFEVLRHLILPQGLFKRHFQWGDSTLQNIDVQLKAVEKTFVPAVVMAIVGLQMHAAQGYSVFSTMMIIIAQLSLALFFARLPNFMEGRLDSLLLTKTKPLSSFWSRAVRLLLIAIPCLLIVSSLMGYTGTSVQFLVLLLWTVALFSVILLANEFGMRGLRLVRQRMIKRERELAELEAARMVAEGIEEGDEDGLDSFDEPDPDALDDDGRKLLASILGIAGIFGVWAVWSDVLPALGILNNIDLWNQTDTIDGQEMIVPVTLADVSVALLVGFVGYVAIQRIPGILEVLLRQKLEMAAGTVYAILTLFRYSLITIVVVSVLGVLGGSWSQIQWAVAALSVGIGFGLQEIVANFISGLILLFEQPIRVGDTVTVGNTSGVVTKIRMRATTIRDWDRFELLVPNKEFITGRLLNWSLSDHINRLVIEVGVSYGTNLKQAMDIALECAKAHPETLDDPAPFITFDEFGDNSLKLVLRCYLDSVDSRLGISSQLRYDINERFNAAGIVVAFPQQDVHLDTSQPLEISLRTSD